MNSQRSQTVLSAVLILVILILCVLANIFLNSQRLRLSAKLAVHIPSNTSPKPDHTRLQFVTPGIASLQPPLTRACEPKHDLSAAGFRVLQDAEQIIPLIVKHHGGQTLRQRTIPRRLVHGMTFDCEESLLEIKLNELGEVVDYFILVEGAFTFQNTSRSQCFPAISRANPRIARWMHKIVYVYDQAPIAGFVYWEAEVYYRNLIGLAGLPRIPALDEHDLVLITDVDELPTAAFLDVLKHHDGFRTPIAIHLRWSYYSYIWMNRASWKVNAIATVGELDRLVQNHTNRVRFDLLGSTSTSWSTGPDMIVGWHCSWCMPTESFLLKMAHFAHSELNAERFRNLTFLQEMRRQGLWFPDASPNACVQSGMQVPLYVRNDTSRFGHLVALE